MSRKSKSNPPQAGPSGLQKPPRPELFSNVIYELFCYNKEVIENVKICVMLTMKDYKVSDVNPQHPQNEPYSHVIVVCVKFMKTRMYQPIGSLIYQRNKIHESIPAIISMLRMYVETLTQLGLNIVGSVSSTDIIFRHIFSRLLYDFFKSGENPNKTVMIYKLAGLKLIHLYDYKDIFRQLLEKWKQCDLYNYDGYKFNTASWSYIDATGIVSELQMKHMMTNDDLACPRWVFNFWVLDMLGNKIYNGPASRKGEDVWQALTTLTQIFLHFDPHYTRKEKLSETLTQDRLAVHRQWLLSVCFKKKKLPLTNISTESSSKENSNKACEVNDNKITKDKPQHQTDLNPLTTQQNETKHKRKNLTVLEQIQHVNSKINEGSVESMPFIQELISIIDSSLTLIALINLKINKPDIDKSFLNTEHVDYFIQLVKTLKNGIENSIYTGYVFPTLDLQAAYEAMDKTDGALMVSYKSTKNLSV